MRRTTILIFVVLLFVSTVASVGAQTACTDVNSAGRLDCGFASTGWKLAQVTTSRDNPHAIAVQPDGKILVAGTAYDYDITPATGKDFGLVRLNQNGTYDTTFDADGVVITHSTGSFHDEAYSLALQTDGKIIVGGIGGGKIFLVRYNSNGSLDTTFGFNNGKVLTDVAGTALGLAVQPDGKIVAMGGSKMVRFNPDGTYDTTFGVDGKVILRLDEIFRAIRLQADGKILIAGKGQLGEVMRFNTNGSVDTTFGTGGGARVLFPNGDSTGYALEIEPDGNIVVAGETRFNNPVNLCKSIFRFTPAGVPTEKNATCSTTGGSGYYGLARQPDGKFVAVGRDNINGSDVAVAARHKRSLEPEISYNDGAGKTSFIWAEVSSAAGVAIQADGKAVLTGYGANFGGSNTDSYFNVVRLQGGTVLSRLPTEPFDLDGDGRSDLAYFRPSTSNWSVIQSSSSQTTEQNFGLSGDVVAPADYDGDGRVDLGIFRPASGDWWFKSSATGVFNSLHWGAQGDIPRPGDFDGDGKADFIVFRPTENVWYRFGTTGAVSITQYGGRQTSGGRFRRRRQNRSGGLPAVERRVVVAGQRRQRFRIPALGNYDGCARARRLRRGS